MTKQQQVWRQEQRLQKQKKFSRNILSWKFVFNRSNRVSNLVTLSVTNQQVNNSWTSKIEKIKQHGASAKILWMLNKRSTCSEIIRILSFHRYNFLQHNFTFCKFVFVIFNSSSTVKPPVLRLYSLILRTCSWIRSSTCWSRSRRKRLDLSSPSKFILTSCAC